MIIKEIFPLTGNFDIDGKSVYGRIDKKEDNFVLILDDFSSNMVAALTQPRTHFVPLIAGLTSSGKSVLCLECFLARSTQSSQNIATKEYIVKYPLIGDSHYALGAQKFRKIRFSLSHLFEWLGSHYSFAVENDFKKKIFSIKYTHPKTIQHKINANLQLKFLYETLMPGKSIDKNEFGFRQTPLVEIHFRNKVSIEKLLAEGHKFQSLLSIFTMKSSQFTNIELFISARGQKPMVFTLIHSETEGLRDVRPIKSADDIMFFYAPLQGRYNQIYQNWLNLFSRIPEIAYLLNETIFQKYITQEKIFFNFATIIETMHRTFINRNKLNFQARMEQFISRTLPMVNKLTKIRNIPAFARRIKDTRNFHAHILHEQRGRLLKGEELYRVNQKLRLFITAYLLQHIGLQQNEIKVAILAKQKIFGI